MLNENDNPSPILQAPGKGLPAFELFMARLLVGWKAHRTSRSQAESIFEFEKSEILRIARSVDPQKGKQQVLIKRLRGMEDSSRFWSVYMTVEHLSLVNKGTGELIVNLAQGRTPKRQVSTAEVKPSTTADFNSIIEFEKVCSQFQDSIQQIEDLDTDQTWAHPWFGQLNAAKWHFFAGFHMNLHRKQILKILEQL